MAAKDRRRTRVAVSAGRPRREKLFVAGALLHLALLLDSSSWWRSGTGAAFAQPTTYNDSEIFFSYVTSSSGAYRSNDTIPAVQMAVEAIRAGDLFEGNYTLNLDPLGPGESECERSSSLESFFERVVSEPRKIAFIGSGCSQATEPVTEIGHFWDIIHLSYTPGTDVSFANLFRLYPSSLRWAGSVVSLITYYGWRQVQVLTQDEPLFSQSSNRLIDWLRLENVTANETLFQTNKNVLHLPNIFPPEYRIYVLNMYPLHARRVLCSAVKKSQENGNDPSHSYEDYIWITHGWYPVNWWSLSVTPDPEELSAANESLCSDEAIAEMLSSSLAVNIIPLPDNNTMETDVGYTTEQFKMEYLSRSVMAGEKEADLGELGVSTAPLAYDAVWSLALALDNSLPVLEEQDLFLEDYFTTIENRNAVAEIIWSEMRSLVFTGVSGRVSFTDDGLRREFSPRVFQYRLGEDDDGRTLIAKIDEDVFQYVNNESNTSVWSPDGEVPTDGLPKVEISTILNPIFYSYSILAGAGIIFGIVCAVFNFVFRKRSIIRLTSPNLNYLIILGCIMMYASVYFFVLPTIDPDLKTAYCYVRFWLQPIGYSICFGVIVTKVWRVYYIFHNPSPKRKKKPPRDWQLFIVVVIMAAIDVIIILVVTAIGNYRATPMNDVESESSRDENNVLVQHNALICEGPYDVIWIGVVILYLLVVQVACLVLAVLTRKVTIKALNDAKYIAVIIYATTAVIVIMLICAFTLSSRQNADAAVFSMCLLFVCTIVLSVLFIPKMVILYKDPKGERIFNRSYSQGQQATMTGGSLSDVERDKMHELQKRVRNLEGRLGRYEEVEPMNLRSMSYGDLQGTRSYTNSTTVTTSLNPMMSLPTSFKIATINTIDEENKSTSTHSRHSKTSEEDRVEPLKIDISDEEDEDKADEMPSSNVNGVVTANENTSEGKVNVSSDKESSSPEEGRSPEHQNEARRCPKVSFSETELNGYRESTPLTPTLADESKM